MATRAEDIEKANKIIREECIPACREKFLEEECTQEVLKQILRLCKKILKAHEEKKELDLTMIDVNVQPTIGGHLSIWASEADEEEGNYAN